MRYLIALCLFQSLLAQPGKLRIAAASDLKYALDAIAAAHRDSHPGLQLELIYGSSGKFYTQIAQGAPYDLFFSADIDYPRRLAARGLTASEVKPYALGRIVLWSIKHPLGKLQLSDLVSPAYRKIAIANPRHAPYGKRAEEALRAAGVWEKLQAKLVFGDNIAHAAQFVSTGNADVGLIALSLVLHPELAAKGNHALIPAELHRPLEQGFVICKYGASNPAAKSFAEAFESVAAREILAKYGFTLPATAVTQ